MRCGPAPLDLHVDLEAELVVAQRRRDPHLEVPAGVEVRHPEVEQDPGALEGPAERHRIGARRRAEGVGDRQLVLAAVEPGVDRPQPLVARVQALRVERRPVEGRGLDPLPEVEEQRTTLGDEAHAGGGVRRPRRALEREAGRDCSDVHGGEEYRAVLIPFGVPGGHRYHGPVLVPPTSEAIDVCERLAVGSGDLAAQSNRAPLGSARAERLCVSGYEQQPATSKAERAPMASKAIVGEKVGMTQVWDDQNRAIPVTVVAVTPARVVQVKTPDKDGYSALQVTYGTQKVQRLSGGRGRALRQGRRRPGQEAGRAAGRRHRRLHGRPGAQGRHPDGRREGRRHRRVQGQGLRRWHEAPQLQGPGRQPRQRTRSTVRPARSAPAPRRPACSRARRWPARWATRR